MKKLFLIISLMVCAFVMNAQTIYYDTLEVNPSQVEYKFNGAEKASYVYVYAISAQLEKSKDNYYVRVKMTKDSPANFDSEYEKVLLIYEVDDNFKTRKLWRAYIPPRDKYSLKFKML